METTSALEQQCMVEIKKERDREKKDQGREGRRGEGIKRIW